jgi:hypothetical protein
VEPRPSIWGVRVELSWAIKLTGALFGCLLGADALARIGACRFTLFEAGGLLVGLGTILLLRPPYQLAALGVTLAAAGVFGVLRTAGLVLRALVEGEGIPAVWAATLCEPWSMGPTWWATGTSTAWRKGLLR